MTTFPNHLPDALPVNGQHSADVWLEQQIWGHRFLNDQTPWLVLLEAIGILAHLVDKPSFLQGLPAPGKHELFNYELARRDELRTILFRDRHIEEIADAAIISDQSKWRDWFDKCGPDGATRFGYLRDRFGSFNDFRNAVILLRSAEIEPERKRRATSRHLAPRGPDMLTADYGEKKRGVVDKDRRFFSRGGELVYLMLNRSAHREVLASLVRNRLLTPKSRWNALAKILQPEGDPEKLSFDTVGYLPLPHHEVYDTLAEDWISVLSIKGLPDDSVPDPLMRLTGLAIVQYVTRRSAEILESEAPVFPIDMVSRDTVWVQRTSKDCCIRHREQSRMAIRKIVDDLVASGDWAAALAQPKPRSAVIDLVRQRFLFTDFGDVPTDKIPDLLRDEAVSDHNQHLGRVAGFYAEQIGLAVSPRGSGRWYAASDAMLEALVFANVSAPMEFEHFLERLWSRYRMVLGAEVGVFPNGNYQHLRSNQRLLEERLRVLGLAKRLSDDCAFVINPFYQVNSHA